MSINIKRGSQWFRPMEVSVEFTVTSYERAKELMMILQGFGLEDEARELDRAMDAEQAESKWTDKYGYVYDPEDFYYHEG